MFSLGSDLSSRRLCEERNVTVMSTVSGCDVTTVQLHNTGSTSNSYHLQENNYRFDVVHTTPHHTSHLTPRTTHHAPRTTRTTQHNTPHHTTAHTQHTHSTHTQHTPRTTHHAQHAPHNTTHHTHNTAQPSTDHDPANVIPNKICNICNVCNFMRT